MLLHGDKLNMLTGGASSMLDHKSCKFAYMKTMGERIKEARDELGMGQAELGRLVGVSGAAVSQWESGATKGLKPENLLAVADVLRVELQWLVHGTGKKYRGRVAEIAGEYVAGNVSDGPTMRGLVPLINSIQAGHAREVVDHLQPGEAEDWLPSPIPVRRHTYALRVAGDSMISPYPGQRSYPPGTILFVEPDASPELGNLVIAKNGDEEAIFKQWVRDGGRDYLKSLNPAYPLIPMDGYEIIGVVKFAGEPT